MFVTQEELKDEVVTDLIVIQAHDFDAWFETLPSHQKAWLQRHEFSAQAGHFLAIPSASGQIEAVVVGCAEPLSMWALAGLPQSLPPGIYRLSEKSSAFDVFQAAIGFGLGCYQFNQYVSNKTQTPIMAKLVLDVDAGRVREIRALVEATRLVRDLVNTPAIDLGPSELAQVAIELAERHGAQTTIVNGGCLEKEFPAIATVGQASSRPPQLIELRWGEEDAPALALVGKGVIFDSGGLSIKPNSGMTLMKKDMGGAAHVLGLASLIMDLGLKVNLRVYIPAVENAISGNAYRPSDIIRTRSGKTVEIGNTDAEGRLVLADALTLACEHGAKRVIDFATLTGAARVALGEDLPPVYGRDQQQVRALQDLSFECEDPLWSMPLFDGYRTYIKPKVADLSNTGSGQFAGSVTAALFLDEFVDPDVDWMHLDVYAWNLHDRPGRPAGGEAQGLRAVWKWLSDEYGSC
jgi:leucyl aminopeptidase